MTYTTVAVHTDVANGSKALEGDARPTFNEQYAIITQGQSNNSNEEKTYELHFCGFSARQWISFNELLLLKALSSILFTSLGIIKLVPLAFG